MALHMAVLTDETLHPIRCCKQEIPMSVTRQFLTSELAAKTVQKTIEYSTSGRTYCSNPDCHQFVSPEHIEGLTAICRLCTQRTCALCKSQQHAGKCPEDPSRNQLLRLATQERWQTCGRCNGVIELLNFFYEIIIFCFRISLRNYNFSLKKKSSSIGLSAES